MITNLQQSTASKGALPAANLAQRRSGALASFSFGVEAPKKLGRFKPTVAA